MTCTHGNCRRRIPSNRPVWTPSDTAGAREAGWFIWDNRAPVYFREQAIDGMVICPEHRATERGKRMEALHDESIKATQSAKAAL